ncbi:MAG: protein kinase [Acidobacteria bacterium]|nr:protein kinase [Acidobacteriota bacterium]
MGVVYEAEDISLGRRVALKFLAAEQVLTSQALERFRLEARAASALNHENICTIYEVSAHEARPFIAMELLEGEPLSARLLSRPFTNEQILDVCIQLADGLDAAHRKGIIHRDLKPANIFLTSRGRVKILDFGLAKLAREHDQATVASGTTLDSPLLTSPGVTVGTVAYMSPEQARGEEVDARSDLFSLGAILYQFSTGRLPFEGPTSAVIFHAILEKTPLRPSQLNPLLPPQLDEVILKCLEKDRDLRCQSAAELRADLKRLKRASSSSSERAALPSPANTELQPTSGAHVRNVLGSASATGLASTERPGPERLRKLWHPATALGLMVLVGTAILVFPRLLGPGHRTLNPLNMQITKLTEDGAAQTGAISPDGRFAAFVKGPRQGLWVKQIATGSEAQVVPPGAGDFVGRPTFSPDGDYIFYDHTDPQNEDETLLFSIPTLGGTPQRILDDLSTPVSFAPGGKQMVFAHFDFGQKKAQLVIAGSDGSNRHVIAEREGLAINGSSPSWSGDGLIAVPQFELGKEGLSKVLIFRPDGQQIKSLSFPFLVDGLTWLPDSSGMFLQVRSLETNFRSQLKFQPYPSGPWQNVTNDLNRYRDITVTTNGKALATIQAQPSSAIYLGNAPAKWPGELKLNSTPLTSGRSEGGNVNWGSDGKIYFSDGNLHGFSMNPDGSSRRRVPDRDTNAAYPMACGTGAVLFANLRDNNLNLFRHNLLTGEAKQLTAERDTESPTCTRDGRMVYYIDILEGPALKRISTAGGSPEVLATNCDNPGVSLSPDDQRIAFRQFLGSSGEHKEIIVVENVDSTHRITLPGTEFVGRPGWAPDGTGLVLEKRTGAGTNLFYQPLDGTKPTQVTDFENEPLWVTSFSFSPDGKQVAIGRGRVNDSDLVMFSNFR